MISFFKRHTLLSIYTVIFIVLYYGVFETSGLKYFHFFIVFNSYKLIDKNDGFLVFIIPYILFGLSFIFLKKMKEIKYIHLVLAAMMYIGSPPVFENDHFRYIWEGKVVAHGENPYTHAPNSKKLNGVNYERRSDIAYNKLTTIYPPLAQLYFFMFSFLKHKAALVCMQILSMLLLMYFLWKQFSEEGISIVLITPFLYKEFIQSVHIDLLAVFILWYFFKRRQVYSSIALSFLVKILGIITLPFIIIRDYYNSEFSLYKILGLGIICMITLGLYQIGVDESQIQGGEAFLKFWFWNSLIGKPLFHLGVGESFIRIALIAAFSLSYLANLIGYSLYKGSNLRLYLVNVFLCLYVFSPVLHTWYLIWPLAFLNQIKGYQAFLFISVLAYYPYGSSPLSGVAELIQLSFLIYVIYKHVVSISKARLAL